MRHFALLHHISTVHIQICDKNAVRYYSSFPVYVSIRAIGMTAYTKKMSMVLNKLCTHSSKWNSSEAWSERERERVNDEKIATKKAHLPLVEQCSCYFDGYIYKKIHFTHGKHRTQAGKHTSPAYCLETSILLCVACRRMIDKSQQK